MRNAIWAEHPFQLYSVLEFIRLKNIDIEQYTLVTQIKNKQLINEHDVLSKLQVLYIEEHQKKWHAYFRLLFEALFVHSRFSSVYIYNKGIRTDNYPLLAALQKSSLFKCKRKHINARFSKIVNSLRPLQGEQLHFDKVYCFTKVYYATLLSLISTERIAVMESWDHPMKFPFLFSAQKAFTWNASLRSDIEYFQGIDQVEQIMPLKFRYIDRFKHLELQQIEDRLMRTKYRDEIISLEGKDIVIYPTTTSSNGIEHEGEMQLIDALSSLFEEKDYCLYIKPKPNGPEGDYDIFRSRPQVIVGKYASNYDSRDMLDDDYHLFRYYLIRKSISSINAGTTFGLEIAYADKPVIQLDVTETFHTGFSKFIHTYHLSNYLLSLPGTTIFDKANTAEVNQKVESRDMTFSQALKKWLLEW